LNLNHIFLFLAIVSPLLVLARGWRPSVPYHRLAPRRGSLCSHFTVVDGFSGLMFSGYVGAGHGSSVVSAGSHCEKITQLAAQGDYESLEDLVRLPDLHPTAEIREQVRLFRHSQSNAPHFACVNSVPADHDIAPSTRKSARSAPALFVLILVQCHCFPVRDFCGD